MPTKEMLRHGIYRTIERLMTPLLPVDLFQNFHFQVNELFKKIINKNHVTRNFTFKIDLTL